MLIAYNLVLMYEGIIKFFNEEKGFGFISDANSSQDFFVHVSDLVDAVVAEDEVTFDLAEGPKGFKAIEVKKKKLEN